ncbi:MAG: SHOCT domain-containing protein [Chloroflexota bacterium]|nr:SHOCT domain-containing protein [Chloroflexota bacterium]
MNKNTKTALIIGGIVLAILIVVPLVWGGLSGWQGGGWGMMGPGMMGGFGWGGFMGLGMIFFWGLVIWGIVALVRGTTSPGNTGYHTGTDSALDVLKKRYAQGEISKEEYEQKKKDLM